jgi:hypothetical protein
MSNEFKDIENGAALDQRLRHLPRSVQPERDMWPEILDRITAPQPVQPRWGFPGGWPAALAAGLVLMAVSSLATWQIVDRRHDGSNGPAAMVSSGPAVPARLAGMQGLGDRYRLDREQLAEAFDDRLRQLQPETREAVLANLRDIQRALTEINSALDADPNNVLLQQLLVATYQEELAVFDQVNRIVAASPRRSDST